MNIILRNTARILLESLNSGRCHFRRQEVLDKIGMQGLVESINRKWFLVDDQLGYYTINTSEKVKSDLIREGTCKCGNLRCDCQEVEAEDTHERKTLPENVRHIVDAYVPNTGNAPGNTTYHFNGKYTPGGNTTLPVLPYRVGDDVSVTEDNVTYTGTISSVDPEGKVRINWKGARPPRNRAYSPGEFMVNKNKQNPTNA
jgi:hypothetical protein